ncbi:MAG: hypothetical protein ABIG85_07420 [Chloroflexota bacterium]
MPLPARLAMLVAVVALAAVVVSTVTGILPRVVSAIGTTLGGIADSVLPTASPSASLVPIPAPPTLVSPDKAYTNRPTATLVGTVPLEVVGRDGFLVRIYVALPDQLPVAVRDVEVGETPAFVVEKLALEPGRNDVTATLVGPGGESEPSSVITYILDQKKPPVTVTSPKNGATVNGATAKVTGKTQGNSVVVARNEANGTSVTVTADAKGAFTVEVTLRSGANGIALTATDPAGNVGTAVLTIRRGSGSLDLGLSASAFRISAARLPRVIELRARVTDPDGGLLSRQAVSFTLSIPGVPVITGEDVSDGSGMATFRTTIPAGATVGSGLATAFVTTTGFGDASAQISITIIK